MLYFTVASERKLNSEKERNSYDNLVYFNIQWNYSNSNFTLTKFKWKF